jgi:hypothetical protein
MYVDWYFLTKCTPIPVASRSKASVCDRSPAEIVGSNPNEEYLGGGESRRDMDVCLLCVVRGIFFRL